MQELKHTFAQVASILYPSADSILYMDEPDLDTMGGRVKYALRESGHTPSSAAFVLECSRPAIDQWILGSTKNIKNDLLFKFADLTGFEARWIATGEGPVSYDKSMRHGVEVLWAMKPRRRQDAVRLLDTIAELPIDGDPPPEAKRHAA